MIKTLLSDPLWFIMCVLLDIDYTEWCMECSTVVHESGRNLKDALYVCGYSSLFQLRWKMLLSMIPKEGDNA